MNEPTIIIGMTKDDEKRLDDIYGQLYAKSESNNMKFFEYMQLLLDRDMITAKYNLEFYYDLYYQFYNQEEYITVVTKGKKSQVKDEVPKFSRTKFLKWIEQLGIYMYSGHKKTLPLILKDIFQENKKKQEFKVMVYDEINKRILSEQAIKILIDFQQDFQALFTYYQPENYFKGEIMLSWKEVRLMNLRLPLSQAIILLHDAIIYPNQYSTDNLEDLFLRIVPASHSKETQFYSQNGVSSICDKIINGTWKHKQIEGDPKLSYLDFQFMITRLGLDIAQKEQKFDLKKEMPQAIKSFFHYLGLDENGQHQPKDLTKVQQLINKFYNQTPSEIHQSKQLVEEVDEDIQWQNYLILSNKPELLDYKQLSKFFQTDLPEFPELKGEKKLVREFQDSLKERDRKIELKRLAEEAKKNKNKPAAKPQQKKGEGAMKYQWEPMEAPPKPCSYQYFIDFVKETQNVNPLRDINQLVTLTHITAACVLLPESLYPIDPPQEVKHFVEAAIICFTKQNYYQAFQNLNSAQDLWVQIKETELSDAELIFFEYFAGQIYEIAGQDQQALNKFLKVKTHADKLHMYHPDKALYFLTIDNRPYCGFGSVLYHMQEYELATRAFTKARQIRDMIIGDEQVESGMILNNLGCCLKQLGYMFNAETCFQFTIAIFELHLGPVNEMTLTAKRNLEKCKHNRYLRI